MNHKTVGLFLLGVCLSSLLFAQRLPIGIRFNTGIGFHVFDGSTRSYYNNSFSGHYAAYLNYRNVFMGSYWRNPVSQLRDSLLINGTAHSSSENQRLAFAAWVIGYSILLPNQRLSIDPYIGLHKTWFENHNSNISYGSQYGSSLGAYVYYYYKPVLNDKFQWYLFLNNSLSFSQLNKKNPNLGSVYYSAEIGFGLRWGSMKDYWQRRF